MEQSFLNYLFGGALACLGWFGRTLWDATQKLKDDLKDVEVDMATNYVRKVELESRLDQLDDAHDTCGNFFLSKKELDFTY